MVSKASSSELHPQGAFQAISSITVVPARGMCLTGPQKYHRSAGWSNGVASTEGIALEYTSRNLGHLASRRLLKKYSGPLAVRSAHG